MQQNEYPERAPMKLKKRKIIDSDMDYDVTINSLIADLVKMSKDANELEFMDNKLAAKRLHDASKYFVGKADAFRSKAFRIKAEIHKNNPRVKTISKKKKPQSFHINAENSEELARIKNERMEKREREIAKYKEMAMYGKVKD